MMTPPGSVVRSRYRGTWEYAIVREPINGITTRELIEESSIPKGTTVTQCVWKGQMLEPRRVYLQRTGPAVWAVVTTSRPRTMADIFGQ